MKMVKAWRIYISWVMHIFKNWKSVETCSRILHHKWCLCRPHTESNCVRTPAKWAQNKCPICLNTEKPAQMSTDIDQGSRFSQEDNGLRLRNRNIGQREVTVSKLTH